MARLNDRGQMLLIGALLMAATFISLGVVLNGSLHTPTLAAEASGDVSENGLAGVQDSIEREVAGLMATARTKYPGDDSDQEDFLETNVTALGENMVPYYARQDRVVTFDSVDVEDGVRVSGTFDVGVTESEATNAQVRYLNVEPPASPGTIVIEMDDGSNSYTLTIDDTHVRVSGDASGICSYRSQIEITNATTDGEPCPVLQLVENLDSSYDLTIEGTTANDGGSYEYITDDTSASGDVIEELIYEVRVELTARSPNFDYEGVIDVAPGEP